MEAKLKEKIWKVLRMIASNNGSPIVVGNTIDKITNDYLIKQFISFCSLWKYYLFLLEKEEEYETCAEILRVVDIQQKFLVQIAEYTGVKEPEMEDQLLFVKQCIIDAKPVSSNN